MSRESKGQTERQTRQTDRHTDRGSSYHSGTSLRNRERSRLLALVRVRVARVRVARLGQISRPNLATQSGCQIGRDIWQPWL